MSGDWRGKRASITTHESPSSRRSPDFRDRFIHGDDVLRGGHRLNVVAGGTDPTRTAEDFAIFLYLFHDILHGSEGERLLIVVGAVERDLLAEIAHQALALHSRAAPLDGVENLDADDVDQIRQEGPRGAIGVVE